MKPYKLAAIVIALYAIVAVLFMASAGVLMLSHPEIMEGFEDARKESDGSFDMAVKDDIEDSFRSVFDSFIAAIKRILTAVIDMIIAFPQAVAKVVGNWANSLGSWYAPILAVIVIVIVVSLFRFWSAIDAILDKLNI